MRKTIRQLIALVTVQAFLLESVAAAIPALSSSKPSSAIPGYSSMLQRQAIVPVLRWTRHILSALTKPGQAQLLKRTLPSRPQPISPLSTYFDRLRRLSANEEARPHDPLFATNELRHDRFFRALSGRRGVLVGVGFQQNFNLAHHADADLVVLDVNPMITEVLIPLIGRLSELAGTRRDFLGMLLRTELTDAEIDTLTDPERFIGPNRDRAFAAWHALARDIRRRQTASAGGALRSLLDELTVYGSWSREWIQRAEKEVLGLGHFGDGPHSAQTFLANNLREAWTSEPHAAASWISSESNYQAFRRRWREGQIWGITGNLMGESVTRLAAELTSQSKLVSAVYTSNAFMTLGRPDPSAPRMLHHLAQLPLAPDALWLRAGFHAEVLPFLKPGTPVELAHSKDLRDIPASIWIVAALGASAMALLPPSGESWAVAPIFRLPGRLIQLLFAAGDSPGQAPDPDGRIALRIVAAMQAEHGAQLERHPAFPNFISPSNGTKTFLYKRQDAVVPVYGSLHLPEVEDPWRTLRDTIYLSGLGILPPVTAMIIPGEPHDRGDRRLKIPAHVRWPDRAEIKALLRQAGIPYDELRIDNAAEVLERFGVLRDGLPPAGIQAYVEQFIAHSHVVVLFENAGVNLSVTLPRLVGQDADLWKQVCRHLGATLARLHNAHYLMEGTALDQFVVTPSLEVRRVQSGPLYYLPGGIPQEKRFAELAILKQQLESLPLRLSGDTRDDCVTEFLSSYQQNFEAGSDAPSMRDGSSWPVERDRRLPAREDSHRLLPIIEELYQRELNRSQFDARGMAINSAFNYDPRRIASKRVGRFYAYLNCNRSLYKAQAAAGRAVRDLRFLPRRARLFQMPWADSVALVQWNQNPPLPGPNFMILPEPDALLPQRLRAEDAALLLERTSDPQNRHLHFVFNHHDPAKKVSWGTVDHLHYQGFRSLPFPIEEASLGVLARRPGLTLFRPRSFPSEFVVFEGKDPGATGALATAFCRFLERRETTYMVMWAGGRIFVLPRPAHAIEPSGPWHQPNTILEAAGTPLIWHEHVYNDLSEDEIEKENRRMSFSREEIESLIRDFLRAGLMLPALLLAVVTALELAGFGSSDSGPLLAAIPFLGMPLREISRWRKRTVAPFLSFSGRPARPLPHWRKVLSAA